MADKHTNDTDITDSIWKRSIDVDLLNQICKGCMVSHVGIQFTAVGSDFVTARMPVDERTTQPFGILHGGASVVLAETLGSAAAFACVEESQICVGIEINANHVRQATNGYVNGKARPLHLGRTVHVWETEITDDEGRLISTGRMTLAVIEKR